MYNSNMNVLKKQKDEKIIKKILKNHFEEFKLKYCLLYTSPSPRDRTRSRMPSSA